MRPDDARAALKHGVQGLIVSNYGGMLAPGTASPIEVLPGIAEAVAGKVPVLIDGNFRRGSDIVKALAYGKLKMMRGEKVTGGTVFASSDPSTYCAMANAGYDFIWTEMQHDTRDWENVAKMWQACPHAKAVPGVRVAYADEREIQHAMDAGALVVVVPTIRTVEEGKAARDWAYFPPRGKRSQGGGPAFSADFWGTVPGGYRNTINDNVVLIEMIETVGGAAQAREIAAIPGVDAVFAASGDLGNFSGYKQGDPDYERLINVVHDAALAARQASLRPLCLA